MDRPKQERRHHGHPAAPWQVDIRNPWPPRAIPGDRTNGLRTAGGPRPAGGRKDLANGPAPARHVRTSTPNGMRPHTTASQQHGGTSTTGTHGLCQPSPAAGQWGSKGPRTARGRTAEGSRGVTAIGTAGPGIHPGWHAPEHQCQVGTHQVSTRSARRRTPRAHQLESACTHTRPSTGQGVPGKRTRTAQQDRDAGYDCPAFVGRRVLDRPSKGPHSEQDTERTYPAGLPVLLRERGRRPRQGANTRIPTGPARRRMRRRASAGPASGPEHGGRAPALTAPDRTATSLLRAIRAGFVRIHSTHTFPASWQGVPGKRTVRASGAVTPGTTPMSTSGRVSSADQQDVRTPNRIHEGRIQPGYSFASRTRPTTAAAR